jgi:putative transposase
MPNRVHVVVTPILPLPEIMRWLKAATANRPNALLGRTGTAFWQREYFDRWIRTEKQLASVIAYVEDNPVRSGLAACPEDWRWSSAAKTPAARPPALPVSPSGA